MSKQLYSGRYVLKISSSRLKECNWNLDITLQEARENEELISLGDSQLLRFIREIKGIDYSEEEIKEIKKQIKILKKQPSSKGSRKEIKRLYNSLDDILFIKDYMAVVFDNKSDFDRATSKKGFYINGVKFKRLVGTTGGIKMNTIMFCSEEIYFALKKRLDNGKNKDVPLIPAKYEAYRALAATVSTPVTEPKGILVINDGVNHIKDKVIRVSSDGIGGFKIDYNCDYETDKEFSDGCGMICPKLAKQWAIDLGLYHLDKEGNKVADYIPSAFNTRKESEKGMVGVFDFVKFGKEVAHSYIVKDAWGKEVDIRDVEIILTTNMLKLWNCYESIDDYIEKCNKNHYRFCVAKVTPKEIEKKRNMNYQYLQSYEDLSDKDIDELIKETIDNINGVLGDDWAKAVLFSKGIHITDNNIKKSDYDFIKALCIDEKVLQDPYVKSKIYHMIEKRIKDAKKGVLQVDGNYQIILSDLYALCEYMFGMEVRGLLKKNQFYSRVWSDIGATEIVAFRSPMTSHNNIKKMHLVDNEDLRKWYKYIDKCVIFNAWDTTSDAMNGADYDGDAIITTNNKVLLKNTRNELTIICEQASTSKVKITESLVKKSNKNGFGSDIGQITNRVTAMYDVLGNLKPNSKEYQTLKDRIILGQAYQQEAIDKIKGIKAKQMPKTWYDYKVNKIREGDDEATINNKEFNRRIMVNKKPYFFIYNYSHIMYKYKQFLENTNFNCMIRYGLELSELIAKENKTDEEKIFLKNYMYTSPVFKNNCAMNRICFRIEDEYKDVRLKVRNDDNFNYEIYKAEGIKYERTDYNKILKLYKKYKPKVQDKRVAMIYNEETESSKTIFKDGFKEKALEICPNEKELCNIVLDIAYKNKSIATREFAWDICGRQIIENLLEKNNGRYHYPVISEHGDIVYNGYRFEIKEVEICEE